MLHFIHFKNHQFTSVQSLDPLDRRGRHAERLSRDPFPVFSAGGLCEQFWHGQGGPLCDAVRPAFPLPTTVSPTLQGALKDGFRDAAMVCETLEPGRFPSLDSCQKRFLWTHKEVDLALHQVIGLVLKARILLSISKQGPCFTAIGEDGGDKRLVELELACEADSAAMPGLV